MTKRLTRTGNSLALVFGKPLLDALRIDVAEAHRARPENRVPRIGLTLGR